MSSSTFSDAYCRLHHLPAERFESVVLARSLYPHARLFAPFIKIAWPHYFAADLDLIRGAAQLRRIRDFSIEALDYSHHPANQGGLRRLFRLRVSTQRLRRMVSQTLRPADTALSIADETAVPFRPAPEANDESQPEAPRAS